MTIQIQEEHQVYYYVLIPNGSENDFHKVVEIISKSLELPFDQKIKGLDCLYWGFHYQHVKFNLHYHELVGAIEMQVSKKNPYHKIVLQTLLKHLIPLLTFIS